MCLLNVIYVNYAMLISLYVCIMTIKAFIHYFILINWTFTSMRWLHAFLLNCCGKIYVQYSELSYKLALTCIFELQLVVLMGVFSLVRSKLTSHVDCVECYFGEYLLDANSVCCSSRIRRFLHLLRFWFELKRLTQNNIRYLRPADTFQNGYGASGGL